MDRLSFSGCLVYAQFPRAQAEALKDSRTFVNRALQDWYEIEDPEFGPPAKGGTIDFVHRHPSPITRDWSSILRCRLALAAPQDITTR